MRAFWEKFSWLDPVLQVIERIAYVINAAIFGFVVAVAIFLFIAGWL